MLYILYTSTFINLHWTIIYRGEQNNRTEPTQTEPKPIRTEPKSISNHSVKDFPNPNGLVRFGFKPNRTERPMCFCNYLK